MIGQKLHHFFRWTTNILRYNGLRVLLWRLLQRSLLRFGRLELVTFFKRDLTQPLREIQDRVGLTIARATESDLKSLAVLMGERNKIKKVEEEGMVQPLAQSRFQKGNWCFLGKIGVEIIHYNWISFQGDESLPGHFLQLEKDEAYCLDAFTLREWRGKGIYPAVHYHALHILQQKGFRKAYTLVDLDNKASRKTHHLHGWKAIGTVLCFTPRGASKGWIWPNYKALARFLEKPAPQ